MDIKQVIDNFDKREDKQKRLEKENEFMLHLLVDIEEVIDHGGDLQQVSVGIKRLRGLLGSEAIMKSGIKPGLVRT